MKNTGQFLKEKRDEEGLSLRDAGNLSGISHTHIRDIENGNSIPSFELVMKILRSYSIDIVEFLRSTGHLPSVKHEELHREVKRVPVISWTQAGNWRKVAHSPGSDYDYVDTGTQGAFALQVRGDSMESEFHDGDIIIINPFLRSEHNDYVIVCNEDWEATFKQLKKYGKARILHPLNPKYDDIELKKYVEYKVLGVVVEKKKRYR